MKRKIVVTTLSLLGIFFVASTITLANSTSNSTTSRLQQTENTNDLKNNINDTDFGHCYNSNYSMKERHQQHRSSMGHKRHQQHHGHSDFSDN